MCQNYNRNKVTFDCNLLFHSFIHSFSLFSRQQGRSETEEYSSDSESESEDEEELQMILEDLQKQNEELEVRKHTYNLKKQKVVGWLISVDFQFSFTCSIPIPNKFLLKHFTQKPL